MDPTLLIAMLAAVVSLLLFGAMLLLLAMLGMFVWRARARDRQVRTPVAPVAAAAAAPAAEGVASGAAGAPVAGSLLGFFDDESSVPGLGDAKPGGLFQSRAAVNWDDSEEGEATEIFSAHSAASDLAEFAFDEGDEATGRFSKGGEPR